MYHKSEHRWEFQLPRNAHVTYTEKAQLVLLENESSYDELICRNGVSGSMHWNLITDAQEGCVTSPSFSLENGTSCDCTTFQDNKNSYDK